MYLHSPRGVNIIVPASAEAVFSLSKPVNAESLAALRAAAAAATGAGVRQVALDIDEVGVLDSNVIATLIMILREAREQGGEVVLMASRKGILDTLRITALDKIFAISAPLGLPVTTLPPVKLRRPRRRLAAL